MEQSTGGDGHVSGAAPRPGPQPTRRVSAAPRPLDELAERSRALLVLRVALVATSLGGCLVPGVRTSPLVVPLLVAVTYALTATVVEVLRRRSARSGGAGRPGSAPQPTGAAGLLVGGLLLDGVFLAALVAGTGGTVSPLLRLAAVHTVAVTLLASSRTGLLLASWHALLLVVVHGLRLGSTPSRPATPRDLLVAIAALGALAVTAGACSAVSERELRRRRVELQALVDLSAALEAAPGPETMADALAGASAETFLAERTLVLQRVQDSDQVEPLAGCGDWVPAARTTAGAAVTQAWGSSRPVLQRRISADTDPDLDAALPGARHVVVLPMVADGSPLGALVLQLRRPVVGREARRLLDTAGQFAATASRAMQSAWLLRDVGYQAATDALTALANRRTLATAIDRALSRAHRTSRPVSLVLLDVDHFKAVNDTFGHRTGDELLRVVADTLAQVAGGAATAARYGGEEFALLLPEASAEAARRTAEAVRRALPLATNPRVTASFGVATLVPGDRRDPSYHDPDLVAEADRGLYAAKRGGRDRVVHVDDLDADGEAPPLPVDVNVTPARLPRPTPPSDEGAAQAPTGGVHGAAART